jgi:hypothetical protein
MQLTDSPTEYTARYAKVVDSIQDAFVFVMAHMEKVGPDVQVIINPLWAHEHDEFGDVVEAKRLFEVAVSGMIEIPEMVD